MVTSLHTTYRFLEYTKDTALKTNKTTCKYFCFLI